MVLLGHKPSYFPAVTVQVPYLNVGWLGIFDLIRSSLLEYHVFKTDFTIQELHI
ncbi:unnamed protein product, partial [Rotaria sp. Silwood1]